MADAPERAMPYATYILTNRTRGVLYTGVTNDLVRRLVEHRTGVGAKFTAKYNLHRLVWFEAHEDVEQAILREKRIKGWNRDWKIGMIEAENPGWRDLARDIGL